MLAPGFFKEDILRMEAHARNKYSHPPPTQSERVWKRFERFSRTAFLVSCSDDINLLLHMPASAFPFPALGASPESGHLW